MSHVQFEGREVLEAKFLYNLLTRSDYEITSTMIGAETRLESADKNDRKGYYQWWCSTFVGTINALLMSKAYKNQMIITYYGSAAYKENLLAHKLLLKKHNALRLNLFQAFSCLNHKVKQELQLDIKFKTEILKNLDEIIKAEELYLFDGKNLDNKLNEKEILELLKMLKVTLDTVKNNTEKRLELFGEFRGLRSYVSGLGNELGILKDTVLEELDKIIVVESVCLFENESS